jgi:hypothetical protein
VSTVAFLLPPSLSPLKTKKGEPDALYTDEAGAGPSPVFAARARHAVMLPPCATVERHLCGAGGAGKGSADSLRFEVRVLCVRVSFWRVAA